MRLRFIPIIFLILFSLNAFSSPVVEISSKEMLTDYLSHSPFNGVILVSKNNEIILKKAFGYKNLKTKIPLSVDDKFQIGSNTKQFFSENKMEVL